MSLKVTYIGHATLLIEWNGITLLTDPVFSNRILCFKRLRALSYDPSRLPKLDCILLSHAHYDHLDLFSYKYIPGDVPIVIPEGMSKAIAPFVNNPIVELATWSRYSLNEKCEICAVPARHPGGRLFFPFRYTKCHGYVISLGNASPPEARENIYFSGDTGYRDDFAELGQMFRLKLALLPLARTKKSWFQPHRHMGIRELFQCWEDLGRPDWIPYHWGAFFSLSNQGIHASEILQKEARAIPEMKGKLHTVNLGESLEL